LQANTLTTEFSPSVTTSPGSVAILAGKSFEGGPFRWAARLGSQGVDLFGRTESLTLAACHLTFLDHPHSLDTNNV